VKMLCRRAPMMLLLIQIMEITPTMLKMHRSLLA